jgi:sulfite reductase (NADPH) flavoprotein alpha-component
MSIRDTTIPASLTTVPLIPENAPFTPAQRAWLNGFLAGMFSSTRAVAEQIAPPPHKVAILFGSESGNCESLAKRLAKALVKRGFHSNAIGLDKISVKELTEEKTALLITSTFGEGDPPENAKAFYAELHASSQPRLENLSYAVLALGDRNYEHFCKCGIDFDRRFEALGAKRIYGRVDCDVDYEAAFEQWQSGVFGVLEAMNLNATSATEGASISINETSAAAHSSAPAYGKKNPFPAKLLINRKLTAEGSQKETRHYEICLEGSGLTYEAGDALGVIPTNCPAVVDDLLRVLNRDGEEAVVTPDGGEAPLRAALLRHYEITKIPAQLLKTIAERSSDPALRDLLKPEAKDALKNYLWGREISDLLVDFPSVTFTPVEFVSNLRKLQPRLYSISSSLKAFSEQVHLTVASVRYESLGRKRKGVCSTFLADRVAAGVSDPGHRVPVFVQTANGFRLPKDGDVPIIMIGPGTGVAPFRAFLHERRAVGAKGCNWLFFGEQRAATDFFYRDELETLVTDGFLTHLTTAFSRDQAAKIYVQHRMIEHGAELWSWLEDGAHFYVCGDASRMAKDVDVALHTIIETHGGRSKEGAAEYVTMLKKDKRYQRDVY